MAAPDSLLTFEDMIIAVAELLEIADWDTTDGGIILPVSDAYNFNLCKRIVNNAIRMFVGDGPPKGWRWMRRLCLVAVVATYTGTATGGTSTTLVDTGRNEVDDFFNGYDIYIESGTGVGESATITNFVNSTGTFEFTALSGGSTPDTTSAYTIATSVNAIDGDGSRYKLPTNFGGTVDGKIEYIKSSSHGASIEWRDEAFLRRRRTVVITTGYANYAAIRPYQPTDENLMATRQWEIIFDPRPVATDAFEFPYTLHFDKMKMLSGTATSAGAQAIADTSRTESDDYFIGWTVRVIHGTGKTSYAVCTSYTKATGSFGVADWLNEDGTAGGTDPGTDSLYTVEPAANLHPAGFMFDNVIMAACLARAQMETQDAGNNWIQEYRQVTLPEAMRLDSRSAPRNLGLMSNGPRHYRRRRGTWSDVTTEHDVPST